MSNEYLQELRDQFTLPFVTAKDAKAMMIDAIKEDAKEVKEFITMLPLIDDQDKGKHIIEEFNNFKNVLRAIVFDHETIQTPETLKQ